MTPPLARGARKRSGGDAERAALPHARLPDATHAPAALTCGATRAAGAPVHGGRTASRRPRAAALSARLWLTSWRGCRRTGPWGAPTCRTRTWPWRASRRRSPAADREAGGRQRQRPRRRLSARRPACFFWPARARGRPPTKAQTLLSAFCTRTLGLAVLPQPHIFLAWLPSQLPAGSSVLPHAHLPARVTTAAARPARAPQQQRALD